MTQTTASPGLPERVSDFIGSIGMNTAIIGPKTAATVIADMAYLGLSNIRNHWITAKTATDCAQAFAQVAAAGIKFDWLTGGATTPTTQALKANLAVLDAFLTAHPGSIAAIEGPNEINNFPVTFNGLTGTAAALAYQQALYTALKADPLTASIPVLNFTAGSVVVGAADAANVHIYLAGGRQPQSRVQSTVANQAQVMPGKPLYITETGYYSLPGMHGGTNGWEGVDLATQAKLDLNTIMDATSQGVTKTYLYDLIDDYVDPSGTIPTDHFGMFTTTGAAKPVAKAIHNLTTILADTGGAASSFTPTALNYTVNGLPAGGSSFLLEKSSGVYDLVVWAEPTLWDATTHKAISVSATPVTVTLGSAFAQVSVFDPLASSNAIATGTNINTVTVGVTDHPVIIQVSSFAQAIATFTGSNDAVTLSNTTVSAATATHAVTLATSPK